MQQRTSILSAFTLSTAMASGAAAMAADLPKEGTFNATYSAFGTVKVTTIGKERVMFVFDENGLTRSDGFSDRMTWHCWGMAEFVNGVGGPQGSCVGTDPAGDQVSVDFTYEKWHSLNEKKFRTAVEGTYAVDCTNSGNYKLP